MKKSIIIVLFLLIGNILLAQPFANEIAAFKKQDSIKPPPIQPILFVGSSTFRLWKNIDSAFPGHTILNRGFGGSTFPDVMRYRQELIFRYNPKQIVIYFGDNDLAADSTVTPQIVLSRFKSLYFSIRKNLLSVPVVFVSIKPSPSRAHLLPKVIEANELIRSFIQDKKKRTNATFVDVFHPMLLPDGTPMPDIFLSDKLHMNAKGYAIWQKVIAPYLL